MDHLNVHARKVFNIMYIWDALVSSKFVIVNDCEFAPILDIDECQNSKPCSGVGVCQNTIGSYDCTCNPGYNYIQDKGCIGTFL